MRRGQGGDRGAVHAGRVTATPPRSEPPLRLRAAGRRAAGGPGSRVAAHAATEEMCHSGGAHPNVRKAPPPPRPTRGRPSHAHRREVPPTFQGGWSNRARCCSLPPTLPPHPSPRQEKCPKVSVYPSMEGECPQVLRPPPQTRLRAPPGPRQAPRTVLTLPAPSCLGCW